MAKQKKATKEVTEKATTLEDDFEKAKETKANEYFLMEKAQGNIMGFIDIKKKVDSFLTGANYEPTFADVAEYHRVIVEVFTKLHALIKSAELKDFGQEPDSFVNPAEIMFRSYQASQDINDDLYINCDIHAMLKEYIVFEPFSDAVNWFANINRLVFTDKREA